MALTWWLQSLWIPVSIPLVTDSLRSWWLQVRKQCGRKQRRCFDTLVILICWRDRKSVV